MQKAECIGQLVRPANDLGQRVLRRLISDMRVECAIAAVVNDQTECLQVNEVEPLDVRMVLTDVRQFDTFFENALSLFGRVL